MKEQFEKEIHALAQQIKSMHDQAVGVYTPLVDDICSRIAPMNEVTVCFCYSRESVAIIGKYIRK